MSSESIWKYLKVAPMPQMHTEKFASSDVGNTQHGIREAQHAYSNSTSGVDTWCNDSALGCPNLTRYVTKAKEVHCYRRRGSSRNCFSLTGGFLLTLSIVDYTPKQSNRSETTAAELKGSVSRARFPMGYIQLKASDNPFKKVSCWQKAEVSTVYFHIFWSPISTSRPNWQDNHKICGLEKSWCQYEYCLFVRRPDREMLFASLHLFEDLIRIEYFKVFQVGMCSIHLNFDRQLSKSPPGGSGAPMFQRVQGWDPG